MIDDQLHDDSLSALVHSAAPAGFAPGFADRVAARVRADRTSSFSGALERQFKRIVPALAAASIALAAYNWWTARGASASPLDAALNLPQITLSSAYAPATVYGSASQSTDAMP